MRWLDDQPENRDFYLHDFKDIIKTDNGYILSNVFEEDERGNVTSNSKIDNFEHDCEICTHRSGTNCLIRTELEKLPKHHFIPTWYTNHCAAYNPVLPMNIIKSKSEMISFISKVSQFFECPEDYERYFGFERKWNEETGDILETVEEYYERGGEFNNIPDRYPCVIYFGLADLDTYVRQNIDLKWIYIGGVYYGDD